MSTVHTYSLICDITMLRYSVYNPHGISSYPFILLLLLRLWYAVSINFITIVVISYALKQNEQRQPSANIIQFLKGVYANVMLLHLLALVYLLISLSVSFIHSLHMHTLTHTRCVRRELYLKVQLSEAYSNDDTQSSR